MRLPNKTSLEVEATVYGNDTYSTLFMSAECNNKTISKWMYPISFQQSGSNSIKLDMSNGSFKCMPDLTLTITSNASNFVHMKMKFDYLPIDRSVGASCAGVILIVLNILIISEVWHSISVSMENLLE